MLDLSKPVSIKVGSQTLKTKVRSTLGTMLRTALERGDPNYIFEAECTIEQKDGTWEVTGP